jgi:thioredoxin reductase (NADPH)
MTNQNADGVAVRATRSPTLRTRYEQMFPVLTLDEIGRLRRFGTIRHYLDGERLYENRGMFVLISGPARLSGRSFSANP